MPRELVGDLMSDEVVQGPVSRNSTSSWTDKPVVLNVRIPKKHIRRHRIRGHATHFVVLVEKQHLSPARVADKDIVVLSARIKRRGGQLRLG